MYEQHSFNIHVAVLVGSDAAAVLQNIAFWVRKNEANNSNVHDGKAWTYNSVRALSELFPYLTPRQMRTVMKKLKDEGLIEVGNFNRLSFDRTMWYTITPKARQMLGLDAPATPLTEEKSRFDEDDEPMRQNGQMHLTKMSNGSASNVKPIPDINTYINTDRNTDRRECLKASPLRLPSEDATAPFNLENDDFFIDEKKEASAPTLTSDAEKIPFEKIVSLYNEICKNLPKARGLSESRKRSIRARWKENGQSLDVFKELFEKAQESDFLAGKNDRGWRPNFDWLVEPKGFMKVIEGSYTNKKTTRGAQHHDNERTTGSNADAERIERENEKTRKWLEERAARARQLKAERERLEAAGGVHEHN